MMVQCALVWFTLSDNLYVLFGLVFAFGILAGLGTAPYLSNRLRRFLGF